MVENGSEAANVVQVTLPSPIGQLPPSMVHEPCYLRASMLVTSLTVSREGGSTYGFEVTILPFQTVHLATKHHMFPIRFSRVGRGLFRSSINPVILNLNRFPSHLISLLEFFETSYANTSLPQGAQRMFLIDRTGTGLSKIVDNRHLQP